MDKFMEQLADIQHDIWAHWMQYQFSQGVENEDGSWTMPKEKVDRWKRQMNTKYEELTDGEKQSDRDQVLKFFDLIADKKQLNLVYSHRNLLVLSWMKEVLFHLVNTQYSGNPLPVWRTKKEADGSDCEEGWFIVGYDSGPNMQGYITYHLPISLWEKASGFDTIEKARCDGHTSEEIVERLKNI